MAADPGPRILEADPFDLPEWLGSGAVTWSAAESIRAGARVPGALTGSEESLGCDLLAVDRAYPTPVLGKDWRVLAHRSWMHGQLLLLHYDDRLTLAVPGTELDAGLVLEALARLAKAVGAEPSGYVAALRL